MESSKIDLNIRGENIQELYTWYLDGRLIVNRRYQRKLVWTIDEKQHLIDTVVRQFPLPLILLAEVHVDGQPRFEIIDGMQRLNAIFSFIENKFAFKGAYFDLETMASSKQLLDEGRLSQGENILPRKVCAAFANYKIPISTYRIDDSADIDEIFRRINSYGRVLSDQEIRQAGVTGSFSDLVRTLATAIRGDVSHDDILLLSKMDAISITSKDLEYGIRVDDMFWVRHGVQLREDIRDSRDEEVIADIIAYIASPEEEKPASSRQARDAFYGRSRESTADELVRVAAKKSEIDSLVFKFGISALEKTIQQTVDNFDEIFDEIGGFRKVLKSVSPRHGTSRYFQVVFLALYELLFVERLKIADKRGLIKALDGLDKHVDISTGGHWAAINRNKNIDIVKGLVRKSFKANPDDPVALVGKTEFLNLLSRSKTEAANYDFKQGLHRLDGGRKFDENSFSGVLETICALANLGKGKVGYVILGVADKKSDAERVRELYGTSVLRAGEFHVVGVDREAAFHTNMDKYLQFISDKIAGSGLSDEIKIRVGSQIAPIDYMGRTSIVVRVEAGKEPCFLGDRAFRRNGAQTVEVAGKEIIQLARLFN
ncbi:GmrSD restriction endonuclease domain-containing protein [Burkholderia cenocepacia]|uniref:GmrSD restriction endonuclease domain-containing protein n=1 Tax=Burkholderia cenocepacia TaxID=95486 RepID=UPI001CF1C774|nr:DUF262 domain-containing protein [Burkholderia cenocepacia]MCA8234437.1 DUF262 domain-containing protein [Burkholderia cenocepacia]